MWFKVPIDPALPPAILLGGGANALSVARSLRKQGIDVMSLGNPENPARHSRFCTWIPLSGRGTIQEQWLQWLSGNEAKRFRFAAIIPCGDDGLEFIVNHRARLEKLYRVYEANDQVLTAMLDKAGTHDLAKKVGVPSPEIWIVNSREDILRLLEGVKFPVGLKPRISHEFKKFTEKKLLVANNAEELLSAYKTVEPYRVEMMVTELIPGGDNGYCSYYTYLDESGMPLFHFTKRKLRQHPTGFGTGTFHVTDWNEEVAELGLKFFQGIGLRGLACIEFKRDPRDGVLKLIEVNHRVTEPNELMTQAGLDFATLIYNRLTRRPLPPLATYRKGICLAKPWEDVLAFRELHQKNELTWNEWLASRLRPTSFLYFKWWDPMPFVMQLSLYVKRQMKKLKKKSKRATKSFVVTQPSLVKESL